MTKAKNTSFEQLSELIVAAIRDEPFFNKEVLIPKVKAIIRGFNLNLNEINYKKSDTESERVKRIIQLERESKKALFWKQKCVKHLPDLVEDFFKECDNENP